MRWRPYRGPEIGAARRRLCFAFFPVELYDHGAPYDGQVVWLEHYVVLERYSHWGIDVIGGTQDFAAWRAYRRMPGDAPLDLQPGDLDRTNG